jgi:hypothetical protein
MAQKSTRFSGFLISIINHYFAEFVSFIESRGYLTEQKIHLLLKNEPLEGA